MIKTNSRPECVLRGTSISPGIAFGHAYIYTDILLRDHEFYSIKPTDFNEEYRRIEQAVADVIGDLRASAIRIEKELNSQIAGIFLSQIELLNDPELIRDLKAEMENCFVNAEQIIKRVFRKWELRFRQVEDEVISSRADDLVDLSRRMIKALTGIHAHTLEHLPADTIIIAKRLLPSDTVFLSRKSARGIITEYGGPASHTALLTRELGIPSIGRIANVLELIHVGDLLIVDGSGGSLVINPDSRTKKQFMRKMREHASFLGLARRESASRAIRPDGRIVEVMANVSCRKDVEFSLKNGADGIGLFRVENIYLSRKLPPTNKELREEIEQVITPAKDKPVTIRLLDVGGDKRLTYLNAPSFDDSFLGRRGIRFLLEYPELLYTQFNALIKLADSFNIRILVPMVTFAREMELVREIFTEILGREGNATKIPLGAMIETPAAALCVEEIVPMVDFLSIGTNDLAQYTLAAGRENHTVVNYFIDNHPAIFKLISMVMERAGAKPVSLCGELASKISCIPEILKTGLESLSVAPSFVPIVKEAIRQT